MSVTNLGTVQLPGKICDKDVLFKEYDKHALLSFQTGLPLFYPFMDSDLSTNRWAGRGDSPILLYQAPFNYISVYIYFVIR